MFHRDEGDNHNCLLVIQCDSGHINGDLIACARYRIYDERVNALERNKLQGRSGVTHVLFIINLPHYVSGSSFVGFQGDPWISAHIDDPRPTRGDTIEPVHAMSARISELFIGEFVHDIQSLLYSSYEQVHLQNKSNSEETSIESESGDNPQLDDLAYSNQDSEEQRDDEKPTANPAIEELLVIDIEDSDMNLVPVSSPQERSVLQTIDTAFVATQENPAHPVSGDIRDEESPMNTVFPVSGGVYPDVLLDPHEDEANNIISKPQQMLKQMYAEDPIRSHPRTQYLKAQCRRLYNCIQAAASKIEDLTQDRSTQRIARLTKLIQRLPDHLGNKYYVSCILILC